MIILIDAEKTCDKIQISFHDKNTKKKTRTRRKLLQHNKKHI